MRKEVVMAIVAVALIAVAAVGAYFLSMWSPPPQNEGSTITVVDLAGREVEIPAKLDRVVVLCSQIAELVYVFGEWDTVVGVTKWAKYNPVLSELANFSNVQEVGSASNPDVEAIIALDPQLIITYGGKYGYSTPDSALQAFENVSIPYILVEMGSLEDLYTTIRLMGKVFHHEDLAEDIVTDMQSIINQVREKASSIPEDERIKALWLWSKPTKVTGGAGVTYDLMVNAGAINPASNYTEKYVEVPLELIISWNPDVLIIWSSASYEPEDLINDEQWQEINAIKNETVYKVPSIISDTWSIRVCLLQVWMFLKFYPDQDMNYSAIADDFFMKYYGTHYWGDE